MSDNSSIESVRDTGRSWSSKHLAMIEKLKQELAAEREKTSRRVVVPPGAGISSEAVASLHVHEGSTAIESGGVDCVLVHEGSTAVESSGSEPGAGASVNK